MSNKFTDLKNLNQTWVIVKRHNGNVFFKRKGHLTCLKNFPDRNCLFYDELVAKASIENLNSVRKKCKYSIENASKYFVNNFSAYYYTYNQTLPVIIKNEAIPIKEVQKNGKQIESFDKIKENAKQQLKTIVEEKKRQLENSIKDFPRKMKELEDRFNLDIAEKTKVYNEHVAAENEFINGDFSFIEQYETQGDRLVKILFSSKPIEAKTQPTNDGF